MARSSNTLAPQVTTCPYTVNKRYLHVESGLPLTVRYIGPLPPFSTVNSDKSSEATIWIGVEWDDPQRGKHSGTYRDLQVFHTRVPGAASFLKFKPRRRHAQTSTAVQHGSLHGEEEMQLLDSGIGLFQAVYQRYISSGDATAHEMPVSKIVLGSSNGQILVEMPNIDKVVQRLRRGLEPPLRNQTSQNGGEPTCLGIKEIGLEDEWVYGVEEDLDDHQADSRHLRKSNQWTTLRGRLTNVNSLNLSRNLIPNWKALAAICLELPNLKVLVANGSRLEPLQQPLSNSLLAKLEGAFSKVEQLHICSSLISWQDVVFFSSSLPALRTLDVAGNALLDIITTTMSPDCGEPIQSSSSLAAVESLDVSGCSLRSWGDVSRMVRQIPSLQSLNLSGNPLTNIDRPSSYNGLPEMPRIHTLILNDSQVQDWQSIDNLQSTFGSTLKTFKYSVAKELQNEVLALQDAVKRKLFQGRLDDRVFLIAKLEGLETLNGTPVTKQERTDAERFYLTQAIKEFGPDAKDIPAWGRLKELKEKHGTSDIVAARPSTNMTLKSKMIDISIEAPDLGAELFTISILPTAPLKLLKTKIARHLGVPTNTSLILTVLEAGNGERREVQVDGRATVASLELTGQDTILVGIV